MLANNLIGKTSDARAYEHVDGIFCTEKVALSISDKAGAKHIFLRSRHAWTLDLCP